jgi:hypothetical protein
VEFTPFGLRGQAESQSLHFGGRFFENLRFTRKGKFVVLGLMATRRTQLERNDDLKRLIEQAAKFVALKQLCLSAQCCFSSTEEVNELTVGDAKPDLIVGARRVGMSCTSGRRIARRIAAKCTASAFHTNAVDHDACKNFALLGDSLSVVDAACAGTPRWPSVARRRIRRRDTSRGHEVYAMRLRAAQ